MANDNNPSQIERPQADRASAQPKPVQRPFDTSGVNWVPDLKEDDPPYRDWWVVGQGPRHE